jgi:hypothetical protein
VTANPRLVNDSGAALVGDAGGLLAPRKRCRKIRSVFGLRNSNGRSVRRFNGFDDRSGLEVVETAKSTWSVVEHGTGTDCGVRLGPVYKQTGLLHVQSRSSPPRSMYGRFQTRHKVTGMSAKLSETASPFFVAPCSTRGLGFIFGAVFGDKVAWQGRLGLHHGEPLSRRNICRGNGGTDPARRSASRGRRLFTRLGFREDAAGLRRTP